MFWLTNGSAARPAHPVRWWLKSGLRCQKLHCPPRQKETPDGQEEPLSDDVMIAVDPHKASNTAAVLDPVTKTVIEAARFANSADGYGWNSFPFMLPNSVRWSICGRTGNSTNYPTSARAPSPS